MNRDEAKKAISEFIGIPVEELSDEKVLTFDMGAILRLSIFSMRTIRWQIDRPITVNELVNQLAD